MKNFGKIILTVLLAGAVSAGVSYWTVACLSKQHSQNLTLPSAEKQERQPSISRNHEFMSSVPTDFTEAAEATVHAVVHIMSKSTRNVSAQQSVPLDILEYFFGYRDNQPRQPETQVGYGSGVIISPDGYIVTNNHVVENADEIEVTLNDQRSYKARIIGTDPTTDIALIKVDETGLPTIPFGNSDDLKVGEWVLAVGNPLNLTSTVTAGIVSAKARNLGVIGSDRKKDPNNPDAANMSIEAFIQTDAAVNQGNSGGALVNTRGELVGINSVIVSQSGAFSGYSFAVPVSIVQKVVSDLEDFGSVQRAVLGVSIVTMTSQWAKEKKINMIEGVYVAGVEERSGAMEAGIKEGDIILSINQKKVVTSAELIEQVNKYHPGDRVLLSYLRNGVTDTCSVELRNLQGNTSLTAQAAGLSSLGATFSELNPLTKKQLGISYGIQVSAVKDGKFKEAGVRKGFIITKANDQRVESVEDFEAIVKNLQSRGGFAESGLFIAGFYPSGKSVYYAIDLSE